MTPEGGPDRSEGPRVPFVVDVPREEGIASRNVVSGTGFVENLPVMRGSTTRAESPAVRRPGPAR